MTDIGSRGREIMKQMELAQDREAIRWGRENIIPNLIRWQSEEIAYNTWQFVITLRNLGYKYSWLASAPGELFIIDSEKIAVTCTTYTNSPTLLENIEAKFPKDTRFAVLYMTPEIVRIAIVTKKDAELWLGRDVNMNLEEDLLD